VEQLGSNFQKCGFGVDSRAGVTVVIDHGNDRDMVEGAEAMVAQEDEQSVP
jgi:hypothetical protein